MAKPICIVTGVGEGTGAALVRRFARGGYEVAMIARNTERLDALQLEVEGSRAYVCDISDLNALAAIVEQIREEMGTPAVLIHNAVAASFEPLSRNPRAASRPMPLDPPVINTVFAFVVMIRFLFD